MKNRLTFLKIWLVTWLISHSRCNVPQRPQLTSWGELTEQKPQGEIICIETVYYKRAEGHWLWIS